MRAGSFRAEPSVNRGGQYFGSHVRIADNILMLAAVPELTRVAAALVLREQHVLTLSMSLPRPVEGQ